MTRQLHPLAGLTRSIGLRILFSTALTLAVPHLVRDPDLRHDTNRQPDCCSA